ncbi:hypothetical protein LTR15_011205 [Elasticomyces elasticus]|nr:hypothetical protein LTR15_011205 [Elasticomyces elasticus]
MGPRPAHLRLGQDDGQFDPLRPPKAEFHLDLPSPRAGEVPPALSPLDAFAMQSRLLAKQFEQEQENGRRMSRLPPVMVQKGFNRPDYFRNVSGGSESTMDTVPEIQQETSPTSPRGLAIMARTDNERPVSHYPMFGHASKPSRSSPQPAPYYDAEERSVRDYFGVSAPRASSPEPVDPKLHVEAPSPIMPSLTSSYDSVQSSQPRSLTNGSTHSQRSLRSERGLYPAKTPAYPKSPRSYQSIRSGPQDSGDEEVPPYNGPYAASASRKFSSSSNMSRPRSPFSPYPPPIHRSPSMTSEYSTNGTQITSQKQPTQRAFNFSRPMSSSGRSTPPVGNRPSLESRRSPRPSLEMPHRHPSGASDSTYPSAYSDSPSRQGSHEDVRTPYSNEHIESPVTGQATNGDYFQGSDNTNGAPSYIYTKYSLPRGRAVDRNSIGLSDSWVSHQFSWDTRQAPPPEDVDTHRTDDSEASPLATPMRPPSSSGSDKISGTRLSRRDLASTSFAPRSRSANPGSRTTPPRPSAHKPTASVQTESTDRTIRATPLHQKSLSAELTPEEHLEVGIQAHSAGELSKSTYHLRLAANSGLPTAMLLYALACRHGWGMRANQEDGVMWLRKAIDTAGLEVIDVESTISKASRSPKPDPVAEAAERRKRKAQFALAVYELGISYMNGWGCPKDKPLAVRCYEVAGSWGDADALAEAGFCYTQGVGCKKDLKKAAMLYRKAAVLGMSMAGNSWIYKAKYMDDNPISRTLEKDLRHINLTETVEKPRSRARSIWGRKKEKS